GRIRFSAPCRMKTTQLRSESLLARSPRPPIALLSLPPRRWKNAAQRLAISGTRPDGSRGRTSNGDLKIADLGSSSIRTPAYGIKSTDTMQDVFAHPELYKNYPHIAELKAYRMHPNANLTGVYHSPGAPGEGYTEAIGINTRYPDDPHTV